MPAVGFNIAACRLAAAAAYVCTSTQPLPDRAAWRLATLTFCLPLRCLMLAVVRVCWVAVLPAVRWLPAPSLLHSNHRQRPYAAALCLVLLRALWDAYVASPALLALTRPTSPLPTHSACKVITAPYACAPTVNRLNLRWFWLLLPLIGYPLLLLVLPATILQRAASALPCRLTTQVNSSGPPYSRRQIASQNGCSFRHYLLNLP